MVLGISEDFSSNVKLDKELKSVPSSGLYLNSGVHPSITVENLLAFLPLLNADFEIWNSATSYEVYSRDKKDVVSYGSKIWQSIKAGINQTPATDSEYWLETNIESLRIKSFLEGVKDRVFSDLNLTKRLVNNQYLYENGTYNHTLPQDYAAWIFEPKGSDYVTIRINEIMLQKDSATPVNVYVINDGNLVDTLTVTPNKAVSFQNLDYSLTGKGRFYLAIDSTEVIKGDKYIDPLRFDGFVAYTAHGIGATPETSKFSMSNTGNGMGFNVTVFLDAQKYIDNNLSEFGNFIRAVFEYMVFQMFLHNSNNRKNVTERIQMNEEMLFAELKNTEADTVVRKYYRELKKARNIIGKTFDTHLSGSDDLEITVESI